MLDHRLAADVHDESDARPDFRDVGEVLLRPDADVGASFRAQLPHFIHDRQIGIFVGCEVVREEISSLFGKNR